MTDLLSELLASEHAFLERWIRADTEAYAARMAPDAVYFDTLSPARIDGVDDIRQHLSKLGQGLRELLQSCGKSKLDRFEILRPHLQHSGDMAVLTYDWVGYLDAEPAPWRATSVFRRLDGDWRVIHAHWSEVQAPPSPTGAAT